MKCKDSYFNNCHSAFGNGKGEEKMKEEFKAGDKVFIAVYSRYYPIIRKGIIESKMPSGRYKVSKKNEEGIYEIKIVPFERPLFKTREEAFNWIDSRLEKEIEEIKKVKLEFISREFEERNKGAYD